MTPYPAKLFKGQRVNFELDAVVELAFENRAALDAFSERIYSSEVQTILATEEDEFMDRGKLGVVLVEDVVETKLGQNHFPTPENLTLLVLSIKYLSKSEKIVNKALDP
ncbi:hypothetical protein BDW68DRAFT_162495 [Aspergillus falconensis]